MRTTTYVVTATHSHPEYCFEATEVRVSLDRGDGTYFAEHPKLGCGKGFATPQEAIEGLFGAHACRVIRMAELLT